MRNAQKQQVEDIVKLIEKSHNEIKKKLQANQLDIVRNLLIQCQDDAIKLGEFLENSEGEGFVTVRHLENYCETVYRIYGEVIRGGIEAAKAYKKLNKALIPAINSVKTDIPVRKEVVFLPYKASMWDSLESLWRAADQDSNCDAYVIPIPYYDRNADGSLGAFHYEGNEYPKDVPVRHFEHYNFAQRRPDVIYIHNPYDDCNMVTSVHPFFYSKNLKQFTEELIYIPYFVLEEMDPNNKAAINLIKHFCTVPAVINADKVVVQSENWRQIYINVLVEETGSEKRRYWEEKISGAGSPKFDKVLNTHKEDLEIPVDWLNIIRNADRSFKKVIFYNTTVGALLKYNENMLVKMVNVFKCFQKHRGEVALLWRPHPLIKATIESMRPQIWEKYNKIVEWYKEQKIGIYDDTADLNRAIALSDAYYGDLSSVVQLCNQVGIPVMIQNIEMLEDDDVDAI